jgi:hypothetical protein
MVMVPVHLDAPSEVALEVRMESGWQAVCWAPCDLRLPRDAEYRTHGDGLRPSSSFVLAPVGGSAVLHVDPASASSGAGPVLIGLGAAVVAVGGIIGAAVLLSGLGGGSAGGDGAGVVVLGVIGGGALLCAFGGAALAARARTTVTQSSAPTASRLPTWNTGLERTPQSRTSFAIPLLSGTF